MSRPRQFTVCVFCLALAVSLNFARSATGQFLWWDDPDMVAQNPGLNPPTLAHVVAFWRKPYLQLYTPLAYTVWSAVAEIEHLAHRWDLAPSLFHLLNLTLHTAAVIFAFLLLNELFGSLPAAVAGALLFAIHPLQVESVAWIAGMNNLLFGALGLGALWQYVLFVKSADRRIVHFLIATALYAAALLSKPTAVVLPLLAAAIDLWMLRRPIRKFALPLALWFAMAIPIAIIARTVQPHAADYLPWWQRAWVAIDAIGFYFVKFFAPLHLVIDYRRTPQWLMDHPWAAYPGCIVIFIAAILVLRFRRAHSLLAGLAITALALIPVLGFTPFDFQDYSTTADRYMYLAMLGPALLAAAIMARARGIVPWTVAGLILLLFAARADDQVSVWHDTEALAGQELSLFPDSSTGHRIMAAWLANNHLPVKAEREYQAAIAGIITEAKPGNGDIWFDYANLLLHQHRYSQASDEYEQAIPRLPSVERAQAFNNWGIALYYTGDTVAARRMFLKSAEIDPYFADPRANLNRMFAK